ncbi:hypothetical protein Taro_043236 [Colocasia esculenta]|uniref:BZIP domain-containing protein n=1 Tax=Colocasia esculenta TaxID=4460 RepID=A0A843WIW3_COLES|nr:hypothetical protein [Colocasia esculenta]
MMNFKSMAPDVKDVRPSASFSAEGNFASTPQSAGLVRQLSIYSLTFDEFQSSMGGLGKDFGSMNMDEFLKSIWTAEETQAMASAVVLGSQGHSGPAVGNGVTGLHRQGSLTLPRTLSQKTVDEVWRDLFKEGSGSEQGLAVSSLHPQQRQPTLGEMTLEEFLVRAGVVREDLSQPASRPVSDIGTSGTGNNNVSYGDVWSANLNNNTGLALGFPPTAQSNITIAPNPVPNNLSINLTGGVRPPFAPPMQLGDASEPATQQGMRGGGGIMGIGDPSVNTGLMVGANGLGADSAIVATGSPEDDLPSDRLGKSYRDLSSSSPVPYVFNGIRGRKCGSTVEKVVERRQRRMIKNRESAARSRARKQAYIMELEAEVAKLKEQNQELEKKQAAILEMQKNQVSSPQLVVSQSRLSSLFLKKVNEYETCQRHLLLVKLL